MNEKKLKQTKKNKKGITLIALVVTIVVLLILAGVTVNYIFSDGGLFDTAKNSGNTWKNAQNSDINAIKDVNGMIANLVNGTGSSGTTSGKLEATISQVGDTEWNNNKAKIYIESTDKVNTLQYQILTILDNVDDMEPNPNGWINYDNTVGITDIEYGQVVYARMFDGHNVSDNTGINIEDSISPEEAIFGTFSKTNPEPNETIAVTVTHNDDQSGVNITSCKWVYVKQNERTPIGTNEASYTGGAFSTNGEQLSLTATEEGTYYLHILTVDNAGNKKESISNVITVVSIKITDIKFDRNLEIIEIGIKFINSPTILPDNATNKTLTWSSDRPEIASVDKNTGRVTGLTPGRATITATATDGSDVKGSYAVEVEPEPISMTDASLKTIDFTTKRRAKDVYGNIAVIPSGFKLAEGSGTTVPEGIVIEDSDSDEANGITGNQFVWIPVGAVYMDETKTNIKDIKLGRYTFNSEEIYTTDYNSEIRNRLIWRWNTIYTTSSI